MNRMRWAEHVACRRDAHYIYWVASESLKGKRLFGTDRRTFGDNI